MSKAKSKGVKKTPTKSQKQAKAVDCGKSYLQRKEDEKKLWTVKVIAHTQQEMMDIFLVAMHQLGYGSKRLKDIYDKIAESYTWLRELQNSDTEDGDYSRECLERELRVAMGEYYEDYNKRYSYSITDDYGIKHNFETDIY